MHIKTVRMPGQKGTRKLVKKYGNKLICVRYRYDIETKKRYKTAELIIDESPWEPTEKAPQAASPCITKTTPYVGIRIEFHETELRDSIKAIGGHWSPGDRLWYAPEEYVHRIGLTDRIVKRG